MKDDETADDALGGSFGGNIFVTFFTFKGLVSSLGGMIGLGDMSFNTGGFADVLTGVYVGEGSVNVGCKVGFAVKVRGDGSVNVGATLLFFGVVASSFVDSGLGACRVGFGSSFSFTSFDRALRSRSFRSGESFCVVTNFIRFLRSRVRRCSGSGGLASFFIKACCFIFDARRFRGRRGFGGSGLVVFAFFARRLRTGRSK